MHQFTETLSLTPFHLCLFNKYTTPLEDTSTPLLL
jgi:hypothetical protein